MQDRVLNEKAQTEQGKRIDEYKKIKGDYEKVFSTSEGQRVLADIRVNGFISKSNFTPGDSHTHARNEGMRTMALIIIDLATPQPEIDKQPKKAIT